MKVFLNYLIPFYLVFSLSAQNDSISHQIYDRPFLLNLDSMTALGGYFEANSNYFVEDGISDGLSFEARRFNIFLFSSMSQNLRFFSELEFEHGTEEIALETAVFDMTFSTILNLRVGILLPPLGRFNVEHDSPKYNIIDRPLVSTLIIPSTLSDVGVGFFGQRYLNSMNRIGYEIYFVNGLREGIVSNETGGTRISKGKSSKIFEEDNNGIPSVTGRFKAENQWLGEIGFSFYIGPYNSFRVEGIKIDEKRFLDIIAIDYDLKINHFHWRNEFAVANIDVPIGLQEIAGNKQWGFYSEINFEIFRGGLFGFENSRVIATFRGENVDLNVGSFQSTGENIGNEISRISLGISYRPIENSVIKISYQYNWLQDFTDNSIRRAGIQLGIATYF